MGTNHPKQQYHSYHNSTASEQPALYLRLNRYDCVRHHVEKQQYVHAHPHVHTHQDKNRLSEPAMHGEAILVSVTPLHPHPLVRTVLLMTYSAPSKLHHVCVIDDNAHSNGMQGHARACKGMQYDSLGNGNDMRYTRVLKG